MRGILLDTHVIYWLVTNPTELSEDALSMIREVRKTGILHVSPISAWEISVAAQKPVGRGRPDLGGQPPADWFHNAVRSLTARMTAVGARIATEAADVAAIYGRKDPGDCFLIATARIRRIPIVTRDGAMHDLARSQPDYLTVVRC